MASRPWRTDLIARSTPTNWIETPMTIPDRPQKLLAAQGYVLRANEAAQRHPIDDQFAKLNSQLIGMELRLRGIEDLLKEMYARMCHELNAHKEKTPAEQAGAALARAIRGSR